MTLHVLDFAGAQRSFLTAVLRHWPLSLRCGPWARADFNLRKIEACLSTRIYTRLATVATSARLKPLCVSLLEQKICEESCEVQRIHVIFLSSSLSRRTRASP